MSKPRVRFIANLWTLVGHPSAADEWSLEEKVKAIAEAGFDGVNHHGRPELKALLRQCGMEFSGGFDASDPTGFAKLIAAQLDCGASSINVQLCDHDTPTEEAVAKTILLMEEDAKQNANVHLEIHRDTCTETPKKASDILTSTDDPALVREIQ